MRHNEVYPFPDQFINPMNKDYDWHLEYCKAAWQEWDRSSFRTLYKANQRYREIAEYMEGRQKIDKYKPLMGVDENSNETWLNLLFEVFPVMPKLRRICMAILNKSISKPVFTPIDSLATDEKNQYFARIKARLMMREAIEEQYPNEAPALIKQLGLEKLSDEPGDEEELQMQAKYTYKHQSASEMELDTSAVFAMNKMSYLREKIRQDLLYYGIAGYKDYIDTNGVLKIRAVKPARLVVSPCYENDFSDMQYVGEVLDMSVEDYAQMDQGVDRDSIMKMVNQHASAFNSDGYIDSWEKAKKATVRVLDLEWASIDEHGYEVNETSAGNLAVVKTKRRNKEFIRKRTKVWYKAKWVIGTERIFDYGRCTDMKRAKNQLSDVKPNYHLFAPSMSEMEINSIGQQVIPILDQIQLDWLKLQQFKSEAKVNGVSIEMGALEGINFGKGGEVMTPREIYDLFEQKSVLLWRRIDKSGKNANMEPIKPLDFKGAEQALAWHDSINRHILQLKDAIGLNDFTDASTPDPRSLTTTANLAYEATNNSLYDIILAERQLLRSLAESVVIRLQDMHEFGLLDRYRLSIGDNSVNWIDKNPKLSNYDFAIDIRVMPTDQERQDVIKDAKALFGGDLVTYEDVVMVKNTDDLKVAEQILGWRISRRRKEKMQESMMLQQQNAQVQQQSAIVAEEEKRKTTNLEYDRKMQLADLEGDWDYRTEELRSAATIKGKQIQAGAKEEEEEDDET